MLSYAGLLTQILLYVTPARLKEFFSRVQYEKPLEIEIDANYHIYRQISATKSEIATTVWEEIHEH